MSAAYENLTDDDRTAVLAEADRIKAIPAGVNTTSPGCAMFLLAGLLFIIGPFVWRRVPILTTPFFAVEGLLVIIGLFWYFRGSGGAYAKAALTAREAIATITAAFAGGNARECGLAAARLVAVAYYSDGPGMSTTFNVDAARQQLGPALPFVISVEKFIVAKAKADPVFTLQPAIVASSTQSKI